VQQAANSTGAPPANGGGLGGDRSPFGVLGRIVVGYRWVVIGVWIVAAVAIVALSPRLPQTTSQSDALPRDYESIKAANLQSKAFPSGFTPAVIVVFQRGDGRPLTASDSAEVVQIAQQLGGEQIPDVKRVVPGPASPNHLVQTVGVQMPQLSQGNATRVADSVKTIRSDLQTLTEGTGLTAGTTGTAAQYLDQQQTGNRALTIITVATIGLIVVLLLVIFRSPLIALLPILLIAVVSQVANGLIGDAARLFGLQADSSISQLLVVVLFGVGTDYILFLLFRYRERLRAGEQPKPAMVSAVTRVGEVIASAAGVVIIAFLAMALSSFGSFRAMGPSLAIAVAVTLVAGLTLVPAVVSLFGTKVFWPSRSWRQEPSGARFAAVGRMVGRRPWLFATVSGAVMLALALAALTFKPSFDQSSNLPQSAQSQVALRNLQKGFPAGATQPTQVFLHSDRGEALARADLLAYYQRLQHVPGVGQVAPPQLSKDGTTAEFVVFLKDSPASREALATVRGPLRDTAHSAAPPGTTALVGGLTSVYVDIQSSMDRDYSVVFPVAAALVWVILALLLRSLVAPWYLMASVGLGFAATLGATAILFQNVLGNAGVFFFLPLIIYMFVVALGTDYNILMVARLREESKEGMPPREATAMAIRQAGPTIASAGLILAGSFGSLMLAGNTQITEYGFSLSFGILVAAYVMAMFFTPSLTGLIGRRAWWPSRGFRVD
jgi:RND superfamily putative drug exporter